MSDSKTAWSLVAAAGRLAVARETLAVFVVLVVAWATGFYDVLPKEVWVVDFPALAAAYFLDTLAFNEFGIRENAVFYPALAVFVYLEAMVVASILRMRRRQRGEMGLTE
jgi:hypothetical protein